MNDKAEKVYAGAFFELCLEEASGALKDILAELDGLNGVFSENPDFVKLLGTPTVPVEEKLRMVKEIISDGKISELTGNLLCVLTERGRMGCFGGIVKQFRILYNEHFKIAEITVTSSSPLSEQTRDRIAAKMSEVTGKTVSIKEKVDPALIGGIVIDYGSTRYDGSVRTRLNGLKKELGGVIA
ncbi:MAG: ATP synthase F1 subunit delta [Oscillospiraceae bacterium]